MKRFRVYYQASVSRSVEVEAEDEDEAGAKADDLFDGGSLCWHCSTAVGDLSDWEPIAAEWGIEEVDT